MIHETHQLIRKFQVKDLMVLVLAASLGLAWSRHFVYSDKGGELYPSEDEGPRAVHAVEVGAWWVLAFAHVLAPVTVSIFALRFFGPRPEVRHLSRRAGSVACAAVTLAAATDVLSKMNYAVYWLASDPPRSAFFSYVSVILSGSAEFVAVATAWSLLILSRRWYPASDWIDKSGFALGVFWLLMAPLTLLVEVSGALVRYLAR
jgi:hypothetical protein